MKETKPAEKADGKKQEATDGKIDGAAAQGKDAKPGSKDKDQAGTKKEASGAK